MNKPIISTLAVPDIGEPANIPNGYYLIRYLDAAEARDKLARLMQILHNRRAKFLWTNPNTDLIEALASQREAIKKQLPSKGATTIAPKELVLLMVDHVDIEILQ